MVQGERNTSNKTSTSVDRDQESRRTGFESLQKKTQEKTNFSHKKTNSSNGSNGSWGPVFKNEKHFKSMHIC